MRIYNYKIILLIKRLLLAMALFTIARLFFFIYNIGLYSDIEFPDLIWIFISGLRFDLSVICYFNLLFILFHVVPIGKLFETKGIRLFLKIYFIVINGMLLFVNLSDSIYFHFVQKRSTADIYKLIFVSSDIFTLLPGFARDYWFIGIILLIIVVLTWIIYPKISLKKIRELRLVKYEKKKIVRPVYVYSLMIVLIGLTVIGARGGLQFKPLSIIDASKHVKASHMPLVLNTVFTCMTTYNQEYLGELKYFSDDQAGSLYPVIHKFENDNREFLNKNIVVLLLESFSKEYVGSLNNYNGFTPFLDSLSKHSMVIRNAYSNGLRSIDAIPAIVTGIPSLMDDPFITSVYNTNKVRSLVDILNEKGYYTSFFHGGTNGTMNFDGFAGYAGFTDYYGRTEYNNDNDYDGHWGIFDEPFLQYFAQKLNSFPEPFFAFEFTLSSHYPYRLPDEHIDNFPEGTMKIHKVVRYTDYALKQFFKTASTMPWYNNTLFIILADHPAQSVIPSIKNDIVDDKNNLSKSLLSYYKNTSGRYAIPMMFFSPGDTLFKSDYFETTQQTDLFPTILEYLNYNEPFLAYGNSLFDKNRNRIAVQFVNGLYQITSGEYSLIFDGRQSVSLFNNTSDPGHKQNLISRNSVVADSLENTMKAILQQYTTRMVNNDMLISQ